MSTFSTGFDLSCNSCPAACSCRRVMGQFTTIPNIATWLCSPASLVCGIELSTASYCYYKPSSASATEHLMLRSASKGATFLSQAAAFFHSLDLQRTGTNSKQLQSLGLRYRTPRATEHFQGSCLSVPDDGVPSLHMPNTDINSHLPLLHSSSSRYGVTCAMEHF